MNGHAAVKKHPILLSEYFVYLLIEKLTFHVLKIYFRSAVKTKCIQIGAQGSAFTAQNIKKIRPPFSSYHHAMFGSYKFATNPPWNDHFFLKKTPIKADNNSAQGAGRVVIFNFYVYLLVFLLLQTMQGDGTVAFYFPGLQHTSNVKPFYVLLLPLQHHVVNIQLAGGPMGTPPAIQNFHGRPVTHHYTD